MEGVKEGTFDLEMRALDLYDERISQKFHTLFLHDVKSKGLFIAIPRTKSHEHSRSSLQ
jgi:hypothetical protein